MHQVYLVIAVTGLVASWIYILLLKAKLRDCESYIQYRIDRANPLLGSVHSTHGEADESQGTGELDLLPSASARPSRRGKVTRADNPKLLVGNSDLNQPFHFICSHCSRPFPLSPDKPSKEAMTELLDRYKEHLAHDHPDVAPGPNLDSEG